MERSDLEAMTDRVACLLDEARLMFKEPKLIRATIVLRHATEPEVNVSLSNDEDPEAVCRLVRGVGVPAAPAGAGTDDGGAS